jgi:hypothetical protein
VYGGETKVANQGTKLWEHLHASKQAAKISVDRLEQVSTYVFQKMEVASEYRDIQFQFGQKIIDCRSHSSAKIPHYRAWGSKLLYDFSQTGKDNIGSFGRYLPSSEHPLTPFGDYHEQCSSTVLSSGIDM